MKEMAAATDSINRQAAIESICSACSIESDYHKCEGYAENSDWCDYIVALRKLPAAQSEYEPVKAEDFTKTISENTIYSFMDWLGEVFELMEEQGFVICKKRV